MESTTKTIIIKTSQLGRELSEKGRVKVEKDVSLDVKRIHEIYYINRFYYIVYETENIDFYSKYCVSEIPLLATKLGFEVRDETIWLCPQCGREVEWSTDEPYCPKCGIEGSVREKKIKVLEIIEPDVKKELEQFTNKLLKVNASYKTSRYSGASGGDRPRFSVSEIKCIKLYNVTVRGIAIIENPEWVETHYDDTEIRTYKDEGKYVIIKTDAEFGSDYHLLAFEGEPQLQVLGVLREEFLEEQKKREEEIRRLWEMREMKRKLEEQMWDERQVVKEIVAKLPGWCDGAIILREGVWFGEDADIITFVKPAKKSNYNSDYYFSREWKSVDVKIPEHILEMYANKLILRSGRILNATTQEKANSKYITIKVVGNGK